MANLNLRATAVTAINKLMERHTNGELAALEGTVQRITMDNLELHFARFTEAHLELVGEATDNSALEGHVTLFEAIEGKYTQVKAALVNAIEAVAAESEVAASVAAASARSARRMETNDIRLEKINLPKFSGEFNKWMGFRDMFEAMVNSQEHLTVAAKYTRLMRSLEGDAAQVVAGFLPTDENYEAAWKTLKDRYDNDRLIVSSHLNIFLGMESLQKETNTGLRRMVDITNETTRSLGAMKCPVEHWDDILVHILVSKLPRATIISWEMEQKGTALPKLEDLLLFLEGRARGLDHMSASMSEKASTSGSVSKKSSSSTPKAHTSTGMTPQLKRSNLPKVERGRCYYCNGEHHIGKCPKLEALPPAERFSKVKDSDLCYNCLTPGHSTRTCGSRYRCAKCNGQHHTILCRSGQSQQAEPTTSENSSSPP